MTLKWLQPLVADNLKKHPKGGTAFELSGAEILKKLGFTNVRKRTKGYDFDAEKDGKEYAIEVKGTKSGEDVVIKWHQIRELWWSQDYKKKPLLMFINAEGEWSIYELLDGIMATNYFYV